MNRRQALAATAGLLGTAIVGSQAFLSGCTTRTARIEQFDDRTIQLLNEIAETILPETPESPGAKAAEVGKFISEIVTDCYSEEERKTFLDGLNTFITQSQQKFGKPFMELDEHQRTDLLATFDNEARHAEQQDKQFFTLINQLTLWGYFSSEPGATKALRHLPVPGRYKGCIDYHGEPVWS